MTDRRLAAAHAAVAGGRIAALSVDVFDTLLWRRVPEPADLFPMLGAGLAEAGRLAPHVSAVQFAELRRRAEKAAREKAEAATGYREITLAHIYAELPPFLFAPGIERGDLVDAEFAAEQRLMIADSALLDLIANARARRLHVICVSDTYFTPPQMAVLLAGAGLRQGDVDKTYLSCEVGRPKWRDLFDVVLKDLALAPAALFHVGDSLEADVRPCRARGIGYLHYDKWSFALRAQTKEMPKSLAARAARLGTVGDRGLTGLRSRLFHRAPPEIAADLIPYWSYGAATLAPVFAGFARWIVSTCRALGATQLHGIMREGRFLNRVVAATQRTLGTAIETRELWLSRRAVVRAALNSAAPELLPDVAVLTPGHTSEEVLQGLGLTPEELSAAGMEVFDIRRDNAYVALCRGIAAQPQLMVKVMAVAALKRRNLLTGLARTLNLGSREPAVVMDLGYGATIQTELHKLLTREGHPLPLVGLYLALNAKAADGLGSGADVRAYLNSEGFEGATSELLSRMPFVLEHACMCREGSLAEFDPAGNPVLLPSLRDEAQLSQMEAMQAGILAGVDEINALLGDLKQTPADDPLLKEQIAAIITASHLYPSIQEATTIGAWEHEAKVDFTGAFKLNNLSFDRAKFEYRGWPELQEMGLDQVYWPPAAFTAADPFIADIYAAGVAAAYRAEHLTAGPMLGRLTVSPDLGHGYEEQRQGFCALTVNAFGRAELSATIKPLGAEVYRRLRLSWPDGRAIIALDQITATFVGETERLRRETIDAKTQPVWTGARVLDGGIVLSNPRSFCEVELGPPPPWPHALEIVIRLKYLRLEPMFRGGN